MRRLALFSALALPLAAASPSLASQPRPRVLLAEYGGIITPVAAEFIEEAVARAQREGDEALVLQLDTPGGLDLAMREAVKAILASRVPVIVYVAPSGARAASAGVYITMAAHFAAMAPGTNIGAAHPVMIGQTGAKKDDEKDETMEKKVAQDAEAYLVSIAKQRGRNEKWAANAVSQSTSTPSTEAVALHVVDMLADSVPHLLDEVDGRQIPEIGGVLHTRGAEIVRMELTRRQRFLAAISDPNVAVILMSLGAAGLFIELYSPGLIFPGIVGVVALVLAFYSFQTLSANFAGVALIFFGFVMFLLEIKLTSHGLLAFSGAAALILGFLMLFNKPGTEGLGVDWSVIASTIGGLLLLTGGLAWLYARAARRKPETGSEAMNGLEGVASGALSPKGVVLVNGELWKAQSVEGEIADGAEVKVVGHHGLTLRVKRKA
jgi:membrane-bound serine protease (ClpP class)